MDIQIERGGDNNEKNENHWAVAFLAMIINENNDDNKLSRAGFIFRKGLFILKII